MYTQIEFIKDSILTLESKIEDSNFFIKEKHYGYKNIIIEREKDQSKLNELQIELQHELE